MWATRVPLRIARFPVVASGRKSADFALIASLAAGKTVDEAARDAHVSPTTVFRRLQDATFKAQVSQVRGEMLARAVGTLADASTAAAEALCALAQGAISENVRLGAARAVLELGARLREQAELEERIATLEAGAGQR